MILLLSFAFMVFFIWYLAIGLESQRRLVALGLIISLISVAGISLYRTTPPPPNSLWEELDLPLNLTLGIEIEGGTQFTVELDGEPTAAAVEQAASVIEARINSFGTSEPIIQPIGSNRILIQIPKISEEKKAAYRETIERVAKLDFHIVHPNSSQIILSLENGKPEALPYDYQVLPFHITDDKTGEKSVSEIVVKKRSYFSGSGVKEAYRTFNELGMSNIALRISDSEKFGKATERIISESDAMNAEGKMAIVLDNEVYSALGFEGNRPLYSENISITGSFTPEEALRLASILENPLQTPVEVIDERGVDPTLGKKSITSSFYAAILGLFLVIVFMGIYYRLSGVFSVVALLLNLVILLGLLSQFAFTLTLPGVAGIILTIGMAVDANVLIFERIREEHTSGKDWHHATSSGFDKAFSSIFDANITTLIAAVIMFWQGSGPIKGFAVVLCLGILASLFSSLIITRTCLEWFFHGNPSGKLSMFQFLSKTSINFMQMRAPALVLSLALITISVLSSTYKGSNAFGVDFMGGDLLTASFEKRIDDDQLNNTKANTSATIQYQQESAASDNEILVIRAPFGEAETTLATLQNAFPEAGFKQTQLDKVSASIGKEFLLGAAIALSLGVIGIFFYVMWRFEMSFAIASIIALVHDIVITLGFFTLIGHQFSLTSVGAILTVAGYSINDTIVVFDRIREGLKGNYKHDVREVINLSINATLSRTLLTSGTTLVAVLALYIFGGLVIQDFAILLLLGVIVGTYSSIFVASPLVMLLGAKVKQEVAIDSNASAPSAP